MATASQTGGTSANAQAQILQVLALQVYNDATVLLGNIATSQSVNITPATGLYQAPDMKDIASVISALVSQLTHIDNKILNLQKSANVPS